MGIIFAIPLLILFALVVKKAGYSGWWVLLGLIPILGLIMIWVFAFSRWPIDDQKAFLASQPVQG